MNTRLRQHTPGLLLAISLAALGLIILPGSDIAQAERPLVKIVTAPPVHTSATKAIFRFKRMTATRTLCRLDKRRYRSCGSRVKYTGVQPGRHIFRVHARRDGRTSVVRRRWTVTGAKSTGGKTLPPPSTSLRFDDEFDGSAVDPTKWSTWSSPGYHGNGVRRPDAVSVSGGNLVITAQMVNGVIETGGMSQRTDDTYGRYEFRVRTGPDPTGTMSGVVMTWPKAQRSPDFTENDMYETGPSSSRDEFDTFIHYSRSTDTQKLFRHMVDVTAWHTIVMDWRPDALKIYRDGYLVWTLTDSDAIPDVLHHVCMQLDTRYDRTLTSPVQMEVDYIRIYK